MTLSPGFGLLKEDPMPWQEVVTVELRQQFVHDARTPGGPRHRALCRLRHQPEDRLQVPGPL